MDAQTIQREIADAIIERPYGFEVGGRHFFLYPATLGKYLLQNEFFLHLGISERTMGESAFKGIINAVKTNRMDVSRIIALHTLTDRREILENLDERAKLINDSADDRDLAKLFIIGITKDQKVPEFLKYTGITKDIERRKKVAKVKDSKNNFTFGGCTMYGQILDAACERYGWTLDYVLWGISYTNLQMMLADQTSSAFLTDKELKECHISNDREVISGDDKNNMARIRQLFNE